MALLLLKIETNGFFDESVRVPEILQVCVCDLYGRIIINKLYSGTVSSSSQSANGISQKFLDSLETSLKPFAKTEIMNLLKSNEFVVKSKEFYSSFFKVYGISEKILQTQLIDLKELCVEKNGKSKAFYKDFKVLDSAYNDCLNMIDYMHNFNLIDDKYNTEEIINLCF